MNINDSIWDEPIGTTWDIIDSDDTTDWDSPEPRDYNTIIAEIMADEAEGLVADSIAEVTEAEAALNGSIEAAQRYELARAFKGYARTQLRRIA